MRSEGTKKENENKLKRKYEKECLDENKNIERKK
jgi:hypothetical protein